MKHFMLPRNPMARENPNSFETPTSPNPNFPKPSSSSPYPSRKHKSSKENTPPSSDPNHDPSMPPKSSAKSSRAHHLPPRPPSSAHNPLKRKLNMDANNAALAENHALAGCSDTGVKVIVRMRPPNKNEEEGDMIVQKLSRDSLAIHGQTFTFDAVADTNSTQEEIFQLVGAPLVENCLAGFNSSIFAYGQTGSGKTYTMWGPANALLERNGANSQQGLTPRVFERLFARIEEEKVNKQLTYQCRCSFLEIYNEQITDLLDPVQRNLQIREDVKSGVYVENLTEELVFTMDDVTQILIKGFSNRKIGATSLNAESSRSHSVFTCVVESRSKCASDGLSSIRISRINLVDLAGSERQKLTGTAGERLKEAGNINRSLSQLGNLINILAEVSQSGKQRHIPYRDSRLTFLLQESLGGNAKLAMICAVSPAQSCRSETFSTLRFAQRAKTIKNAAVVNEVTQDDVNVLRDVIRQLKDELLRMKENGNNSNGGCATGWNARRSLNLLKRSLNCPMTLSNIEEDSDEEMEIDEEAVERLSVQVSCSSESSEQDITNDVRSARTQQPNVLSQIPSGNIIVSEESDVNMEDCQLGVTSEGGEKHCIVSTKVVEIGDKHGEESIKKNPGISDCRILARNPEEQSIVDNFSESVDGIGSEIIPVTSLAQISPTHSPDSVIPSELSVTSTDVSPVLKSPPLSISPRLNSSRKSLKTSSMVSASQKDLTQEECLETEAPCLSFGHMKSGPVKAPSTRTSKNCHASTEHLEESLHRGLQIIDNHRQSTSLRRSSFRFSYKPTELKSILLVEKVDVGVQTLPEDCGKSEDLAGYLCGECMRRVEHNVSKELNENSEMQLVPVDESLAADKSKMQVPKAVEKVLAGAIRREMALDEFCTKQTAEISQLNRLIQQYKHERECNAIIGQTREDKIVRLENLMDGILPTEEFMQEELLSLANEHKLLKAKYDNHPEVLRTRIELKRVQDDLDAYRNFFDMGERDVLIEEIHHLRSQLKYYVDSSPIPSNNRSSLLQLTHPESSSGPLSTISESTEESVEDKFEQERRRWNEIESDWISLAEELKVELEASRSLVKKQHQELESEKKCSEELKEAMQMAMQGHARMLEQYADLQESHFELLARHRKMQEGIEDVKRAAARAGVKGAESRFINSLAAEISALRAEKEKERQYLMDENKGLQAQLRDTAEAVQAAGELLVRLKEAEEIAIDAQKRAAVAEQEAEKANRQVEGLKKQHKIEIDSLNQIFAESRLPKEALRPVCNDSPNSVKYDTTDCLSTGDEKWKEEFQQIYDRVDETEVSKLEDPASWYAGYDRCNI